ncbi:MAG TPA: hypothetical protein VIP98_00370, partial [Microlunatus sp.]
EPRIGAAVFGGVLVYDSLVDAASTITIPIQYLLPWQDPELDRQAELDLFDAFGSADKTLHATVGSHFQVPWFETEDSARFYARQLARPEEPQSTDRPGLRV